LCVESCRGNLSPTLLAPFSILLFMFYYFSVCCFCVLTRTPWVLDIVNLSLLSHSPLIYLSVIGSSFSYQSLGAAWYNSLLTFPLSHLL
jgi:hypothetical protein